MKYSTFTVYVRVKSWPIRQYVFFILYFSGLNSCVRRNGGCSQICKNKNGSIVCNCIVGYESLNDGIGCSAKGKLNQKAFMTDDIFQHLQAIWSLLYSFCHKILLLSMYPVLFVLKYWKLWMLFDFFSTVSRLGMPVFFLNSKSRLQLQRHDYMLSS